VTSTKPTYNILALDGGGLRGLLTSVILDRLGYTCPGFLPAVDLFAGTSTGGILALALARGLPPYEVTRMYLNHGAEIFARSPWRRLKSLLGLSRAKYDDANLRRVLGNVLGPVRLGELPKKVVVAAFDLDDEDADPERRTWRPKIFHNFPGEDSDGTELALDAALATSAAPTYFPSSAGYVDGGVYANNPSLVALCQALDGRNHEGDRPKLEDVRLLSVGTGESRSHVEGDVDWGVAEWAPKLVDLLTDGVSGVADYQCRQLLGDHYCRVQVKLGHHVPMDDPSRLGELLLDAQGVDLGSKTLGSKTLGSKTLGSKTLGSKTLSGAVAWLRQCGWSER